MNAFLRRCRRRARYPFFLFLVFLAGCARTGTEFSHDIKGATTGHPVAWAKPLAGGPLRVLVIAPRFTLGDLVEIEARLDMDYEVVALWEADSIGYDPASFTYLPAGGAREEILDRIRDQLRHRWDVMVLANVDTSILPEEVLSRILEKVADGAGLVTAHLHDAADSRFITVLDALEPEASALPLWRGVGECALPGGIGLEGIARVLRHEEGRIVNLMYPGDPPRHHCLIQVPGDPVDMDAAYEDNVYALAIRALFAAAGRANAVRIQAVRDIAPAGPDDLEIPPEFYPEFVQAMRDSVVTQPSRPFQLVLDGPADQRYEVHTQLRRVDSDIQIQYRDTTLLPKGADTHAFEIPIGPGVYMLDVWLQTRRGVADWFTADITAPGWPEFYNLELEKTWLFPTDSLEISVEVRPVAAQHRSAVLYARAIDSFGRIVSDTMGGVSHRGGLPTLRLHFSDLIAPVLKVEVYALDGPPRSFSEWELHCAYREVRYLSVRQRTGPMNLELLAATAAPDGYGAVHFLRAFADAGVHAIHAPAAEATIVAAARAGVHFVPELIHAAADRARDAVFRDPCLNDPVYRSRLEPQLRETTLRHWAGTRGRYSLGNGNLLSASGENVCQCRHCLGAFQEVLEADYGTVTALNEAWQDTFGDWDFVEAPRAMGPGHDGPPAPWMDFRLFMDRQFADFHQWARRQVVAADREGRAGARFYDDTDAGRGYYWPDLFRALDFVVADYSPLFLDKLRSYGTSGAWSGVALPDARFIGKAAAYDWLAWRLGLNQAPVLWLDTPWGEASQAAPGAWLRPDREPTAALQSITAAVRGVRDTVGPLLYAAERTAPQVAIYDSHPSRHFSEVNAEYTVALHEAQEAATQLLRLTGYEFRFIDKKELSASGALPFVALILPLCRALDAEERRALRAFVEDGGALIADVLPGDFNAHGMAVPDGGLQDLFGVVREGVAQVRRETLMADGMTGENAQDAGWAAVDTALRLRGGVPLASAGDGPAWIVHRHGRGHTLLLNHPFRKVRAGDGRRVAPAEWEAMAVFLGDLQDMRKEAAAVEDAFLGQRYRYTFHAAKIHALQADPDASRQSVRLGVDADDVVYNLLTGERVSRPHRHRVQLEAGAAAVYSVLPYRVKELRLEAPEVAYTGQRMPVRIMVLPEDGKAGTHLFTVDFMPWGKAPLLWYRRSISAENGFAEFELPLAMNELLGRHTLRVRDLLTGMESTVTVTISLPLEPS